MIRCEESRWYRRYQSAFVLLSLGGGIVMLLGAALAHDSASIALIVIGGGWTVMGAAGARQRHHVIRAVRLDDALVTFISPSEELRVPVSDILEIRRSRGDVNRFSPLRVNTASHGTIRISPRLEGLVELLVELRSANPALQIRNL